MAFESEEPICIYADFDLDGTTGLALLKTGMEGLGFQNIIGYQPSRLSEGYGVHVAAIQQFEEQGIPLIVTVDVGITAREALIEAENLGIDVIVTDHHLPSGDLPPAYAIINPNQGTCTSNLGHLAGVGVAFYLLLALRLKLRERGIGHPQFDLKSLLDFFVIGTLTDMVPLIDENRVLVRHGLKVLSQTQRPGLRALLDRLDLSGRELSSQDVAIKFAPKLNALSRLESEMRPIDMFLVASVEEAESMAGKVLEINKLRMQLQKQAESVAREQVQKQMAVDGSSSVILVIDSQFHKGVVGLVATRMAQEFNKPAFVAALNVETGTAVGSARLPDGDSSSLVAALESAHEFLVKYGGHAQAAGFEVAQDQIENLKTQLNLYFSNCPKGDVTQIYDASGVLDDINLEFMRWKDGLEPFGSEFESPVLRIERVRIAKVFELKGGHLRLELEDSEGKVTERKNAIWFSPQAEKAKSVYDAGSTFNVLAEPQWNYFMGKKSIQLLIQDIQVYR